MKIHISNSENISLQLKPYLNKVNIIVSLNKEEWVCRKETIKNIEAFLQKEEASIFKGRLQLSKVKSKIFVEVKKEVVGSMQQSEFESALNKIK
jgi:hypothetical protein